MNEIVKKVLLAGDKCMPGMHLKQPGFTCSACRPFTKNKKRIQNFMEKGNTNYIYENDLDKACFQHDIAYGKYKELTNRTESDNFLWDQVFKVPSNLKDDGYERGLTSMVHKFFDKKSKGSGIKSMSNHQLENELHKPIIKKKLKKDIWGVG